LILLSLLNLDLFMELVIAGLVGVMLHLLRLPCWIGERTREEDRWVDSLFGELDRHGNCLGCHYGCVSERKAADFEAWLIVLLRRWGTKYSLAEVVVHANKEGKSRSRAGD
jgi:hypothetical protein